MKEMWLIWRSPKSRRRFNLGTLIYDKDYTFYYTNPELDEAIENGFTYFPGFEDLKKTYKSSELFVNIKTRLPNQKRPDYEDILASYHLSKESTEMDILMKTKGRLITDNYEFVPIFNPNNIEFEIAGTNHCHDVLEYKQNPNIKDKLLLVLDSDNPYDSNAIKVIVQNEHKKYHLGYVPRYYSKELTELLKKQKGYESTIESINFESILSDENITAKVKINFE